MMTENQDKQTNCCIPIPTNLAKNLRSRFSTHAASAASFVQQIHYWTSKGCGKTHEGLRWVYNTYEKWIEQLQWLSDFAFRKIRNLLVKEGIIRVDQLGFRDQGRDRTCWYALNYDHEFIKNDPWFGGLKNSSDAADVLTPLPFVDCSSDITNTTSENSPEKIYIEESEKKEKAEAEISNQSDFATPTPVIEPTINPLVKQLDLPSCPRPLLKSSQKDTFCAALEPWEIAPQQPYPYFLQWRALHFKQQGGSWANTPLTNARNQFYNNIPATNLMWQEFLAFYNLTLDNALALTEANIEVKLPSCFSDRPEISENVVMSKVEKLAAAQEKEDCVNDPAMEIKQHPNLFARIATLVNKKQLPKNQTVEEPTSLVDKYLGWIRSGDNVLRQEASRKLMRIVAENEGLTPVFDEEGQIINVLRE